MNSNKVINNKLALKIASYNCRSFKNSVADIVKLCDTRDIVCLQEHWLLSSELHNLNSVHPDFYGFGMSAVDVESNVLRDRPYGGTGILYRKRVVSAVSIIDSVNDRVTAIIVSSCDLCFIMACVYMPTDYGDSDSLYDYVETCSYIESMLVDSDINQFCFIGDMNCSHGSRFFPILNQLAISNYLSFADIRLLSNVVTYVNDDGMHESWIDHVLCSQNIDNNITSMSVLNDYIISDHRPLSLCLYCNISSDDMSDNYTPAVKMCPQWNKADGTLIGY